MGAQALLSRLKSSIVSRTGIGDRATTIQLTQAREKIAEKNEELRQIRRQMVKKDRELARLRTALENNVAETHNEGLRPENIIWVFGTARTGSTWLGSMIGDAPGHYAWREPNVGNLFGTHYYERAEGKYRTRKNEHWERFWILGEGYREVWINSIRSFVLEGARARFPEMLQTEYLVAKEPHGSMGAPLLMEALPESRMIFLIRDPRDVVSSGLLARKKGGWLYERSRTNLGGEDMVGDISPDETVRELSERYLNDIGKAKAAYEAHEGYKVLVRYEDLRADTLVTMKRIYHTLDMPVDEEELARTVEKHAFENLPDKKKGPGKTRRKATPGGWREDLTPEQAEIVEKITAPLLHEYYGSEASEPNLRLV